MAAALAHGGEGEVVMVWIYWAALGLAALAVFAAAVVAYGARRWASGTRALVERLEVARVTTTPVRYDAARELDGLPAPVQRYFRTVLTDGQPLVAAATVEHRGTFKSVAALTAASVRARERMLSLHPDLEASERLHTERTGRPARRPPSTAWGRLRLSAARLWPAALQRAEVARAAILNGSIRPAENIDIEGLAFGPCSH